MPPGRKPKAVGTHKTVKHVSIDPSTDQKGQALIPKLGVKNFSQMVEKVIEDRFDQEFPKRPGNE